MRIGRLVATQHRMPCMAGRRVWRAQSTLRWGSFQHVWRPLLLWVLLSLSAAPGTLWADSGAVLVVSTFDVNQPGAPGTMLSDTVRISNRGSEQLSVRVSPRAVDLLDDGQTRFGDAADPLWVGALSLSESQLTLPAGSSHDVIVHVAIPSDMPPDDYITGLIVTPVPTAREPIEVVNEIGALLPISVMGDRVRSLALVSHSIPQLTIGDSVTGTVRVKDTGTTMASPWLEASVVNSILGDQVADIQLHDQVRVAPGASRDLSYTWNAGITAGKFRVPVRVFYNRDNATSAEIDLEEEIWLVHPLILGAVVVLLLGAIAASLMVIRRKRGYLWPLFGRTRPEPVR